MFQTTDQDIKNGKTGDMSSLPFDETRVIGSDHASWSAEKYFISHFQWVKNGGQLLSVNYEHLRSKRISVGFSWFIRHLEGWLSKFLNFQNMLYQIPSNLLV
jgi:hypothetical protein